MVNRSKKLFNVALESKTRPTVIPTHCPGYVVQHIHTFVRSFSNTAGKRIGYKGRLKDWIQRGEYGVVQYPISDRCLVYTSRFWIVDVK